MVPKMKVIADFECPVCYGYMHPPIGQCVMGHSVCEDCFAKIDQCPICRQPKSECTSKAAEKVHARLVFPCVFRYKGCKKKLKGAKIRFHERYDCKYGDIDPRTRITFNEVLFTIFVGLIQALSYDN